MFLFVPTFVCGCRSLLPFCVCLQRDWLALRRRSEYVLQQTLWRSVSSTVLSALTADVQKFKLLLQSVQYRELPVVCLGTARGLQWGSKSEVSGSMPSMLKL